MANCICAACKWRISTILFPSSVILSLLINSPYLIPTDQLDFTSFYKWQYSIVLQQAWALLKKNRNTESGKFLCSSDSFWGAVVIALMKVPFRWWATRLAQGAAVTRDRAVSAVGTQPLLRSSTALQLRVLPMEMLPHKCPRRWTHLLNPYGNGLKRCWEKSE